MARADMGLDHTRRGFSPARFVSALRRPAAARLLLLLSLLCRTAFAGTLAAASGSARTPTYADGLVPTTSKPVDSSGSLFAPPPSPRDASLSTPRLLAYAKKNRHVFEKTF